MSRRRLFVSLGSMAGLVNLARVVFAPLLAEFIAVFGVGEGTAGLIATLAWLGSALPRLPAGWLLTRFSRHHVVVGSGATLTVAAGFTATADSVPMLAAGALLMGVASGVYFPAANPLISELFPDRMGRMLGIHGMANQVAAVAAAPFVTLVLAVFLNWRVVFVVVGVFAALSTVAVTLAARDTDLPRAGATDRDLLGAARREWRVVLLGVTIMGGTGFVWQGVFNFYELYMLSKGLGAGAARNMLTVVFAAGLPAFVFSGALADRLPKVPYLLAILAVFVAGILALTVAEGTLALVLLSALAGYALHSLIPAMDTYLLDTLPDDARASAYSVYSFGMMVVQASGASVVGALVEGGAEYDAVFATLAAGLGVLMLSLLAAQRAGRLPA